MDSNQIPGMYGLRNRAMAVPTQPTQPMISSAYDRRLGAFGGGVATPGGVPVNQGTVPQQGTAIPNMNPGVGTLKQANTGTYAQQPT